MRLNTLRPAKGSRRPAKRVGRGIGTGKGKTCGRGHKGQRSRKSGPPRPGFEGGQMPLQRRLPKFGFSSRKAKYAAQVRVGSLVKCDAEVIDLAALREVKLVNHHVRRVKVIAAGDLQKAVVLRGLAVTSGAREIIEKAGGKIE